MNELGETGAIFIGDGTISVEVLPAGASVRSLRLGASSRSLVVGAADPLLYGRRNRDYLGASVGRNANRVGAGCLPIAGQMHSLSLNEPPNHLHGGTTGFSFRDWTVEEIARGRCVMSIEAMDGEDGYPGRANVTACFSITDERTLSIVYEGRVDRASALNLTSHLYFNLSGGPSTQDHLLHIDADHYLPINLELLPTGVAAPVEGTPFDFRNGRRLSEGPSMLDHNFCLADRRTTEPRPAATLTCEPAGIALHVSTTECGLQVYDGNKFDGTTLDLGGHPIEAHGAIAIEPQAFPDWPNHPAFPGGAIGPGEIYRHISRYRFESL